jgi:hypothetical protein
MHKDAGFENDRKIATDGVEIETMMRVRLGMVLKEATRQGQKIGLHHRGLAKTRGKRPMIMAGIRITLLNPGPLGSKNRGRTVAEISLKDEIGRHNFKVMATTLQGAVGLNHHRGPAKTERIRPMTTAGIRITLLNPGPLGSENRDPISLDRHKMVEEEASGVDSSVPDNVTLERMAQVVVVVVDVQATGPTETMKQRAGRSI